MNTDEQDNILADEGAADAMARLDIWSRLGTEQLHAFTDIIASVRPGCDMADCDRAMGLVDQLKKLARCASAVLEANLIEKINSDGDLVIGDIRYYVAPNKSEKCESLEKTSVAILERVGGDFAAFSQCLASTAFRVGEAKKVLGDTFPEYFTQKITIDLRTGKPKKGVKRADTRFLPPKGGATSQAGEPATFDDDPF